MTLSAQYVAGLFDGEGSVSISMDQHKHRLRVNITNTYYEVLLMIQAQYGGSIHAERRDRWDSGKVCYTLHMAPKAAIALLQDIEPYVIIKKAQVVTGIMFQQMMLDSGQQRLSEGQLAVREAQRNLIMSLNGKKRTRP